jgi:hypothetical protein
VGDGNVRVPADLLSSGAVGERLALFGWLCTRGFSATLKIPYQDGNVLFRKAGRRIIFDSINKRHLNNSL